MTGLIPTPVGLLWVHATARGLARVELGVLPRPEEGGAGQVHFQRFKEEVARYFAGEAVRFAVPLDYQGLPEARVRLYEAVRQIPFGTTTSYGAVGRMVGLSARAVGAGLGSCPFFLAVPAHRVVYADGRLGGFAGREGVKRWLLRHEGVHV
ncbi:methylated-DNA--[protein]-cysteine S-methyltransferase [Marinithermus hydrothermalis]|uniref:Methylated-DNA/protein-cysteinemethyltransferase n=1 Tax=Marinithermus hydrothermalis (strain DSM 14884 / JCM 11576 / T1) TaxID=869210 RepID=F2NLY5_MARHT|nr:methylated-DNA--[protein]-cysteine S-methyltransferase [Marinithermus hydrothermalis]AEB11242.1 methylated-DNA/protein-cysteinemethyltransferase [Marinithermus hydrothermalis DSM 14884]